MVAIDRLQYLMEWYPKFYAKNLKHSRSLNLQALGHETFCSVGADIIVYDRTQITRNYSFHHAPIIGMMIVGKNLISFDEENNIKVSAYRI